MQRTCGEKPRDSTIQAYTITRNRRIKISKTHPVHKQIYLFCCKYGYGLSEIWTFPLQSFMNMSSKSRSCLLWQVAERCNAGRCLPRSK